MVLPSPILTPQARARILQAKKCTIYMRPDNMAGVVDEVIQLQPNTKSFVAPELQDLSQDAIARPTKYQKSWEEGKNDPWLVFHTSGTTGES